MALNKPHVHGTIELKHILSKKDLRGATVTILYSYKQKMEVCWRSNFYWVMMRAD